MRSEEGPGDDRVRGRASVVAMVLFAIVQFGIAFNNYLT